jgi:hypothetical protein
LLEGVSGENSAGIRGDDRSQGKRMNKLFGAGTEGNVLLCILEPGNIHKLTHGEPIDISLNEGPWWAGIPPKVKVVIAYSETPIRDQREIEKLIGSEKVIDQRTPVSEKKRPHCPECKSTIEQLGVWRSDDSPLWLSFCYVCGCVLGVSKPIEGLEKKK